jgi:hypothetical protein
MKYKYFKKFLFIVFVLIAGSVFAQGPPPPPPPYVPIDGGILGLFILAIGYAVKKIRDVS